ncbi:MAG: hypothetical protein ABSH52_17460 [Terriglobia bacterium]|jgi:hypothetical protein
METSHGDSFTILRVIAERTRQYTFPNLRRPPIPPNQPATLKLVSWGAQVYCFLWMRHLSRLVNGIITLRDTGNMPSARILARSVFELGAHAYYVKKHIKQHLASKNLDAAWNFLSPITTGSRYINEQHPEQSEMFPLPSHISKVVNCFGEVMPSSNEGYSFLSELCQPNMFAFSQYYRWPNPFEVRFVDHDTQGVFGTTTASCVQGLLAIEKLLRLAEENRVRSSLVELLVAVSK